MWVVLPLGWYDIARSVADLVRFLLIVEEGAIIGCNADHISRGSDSPPAEWFTNRLGEPLGPPVTNLATGVATRHFASGTTVTWDSRAGKGSIAWG